MMVVDRARAPQQRGTPDAGTAQWGGLAAESLGLDEWGTGQGLRQVYGVAVKKHGGSAWFSSSVDHGSTFYLRLPEAGTMQEAG